MSEGKAPGETLRIRRVFSAPLRKVFRAWTEPEEVKKWWRVGEDWTTPLAEIDLRIGGRFVLGTKPPHGDLHVVRGEFLEVASPNRVVYTWRVDGREPEENEVTVEFRTVGEDTEVTIIHSRLSRESTDSSEAGWEAVLGSLEQVLALSTSHSDILPNS